ncbi:MAG: altronate dehydratase large subunit [Clostridia bacterium]|nr:Altronate dehydratase [Clostridiales bacterium]MDK2986549.1 altronate dehydratase large subunit [Clostridia bacterium]
MKIKGYVRENGAVGIRNHVAIIAASVCSGQVVNAISSQVEGTVPITHQHGCSQIGKDLIQTERVLVGLGKNPNVAAVLVVALGCEGVVAEKLVEGIKGTGKPVETLIIQQEGGSLKCTEKGVRVAKELVEKAASAKRTEVDISELILGMECGGSDTTSGIASNPVVGKVSDLLVADGGTSILSETTEVIGAEHILARRAVNEEVANDLLRAVKECEQRAISCGVDLREGQPTPGNKAGGITTIEEKSLGCIYKAGTADLQGVLQYGEEIKGKGMYFMDTPGQDIESITGMVAGGAQIVIFTTGRGTPTGCPIAPVIKVSGNPETCKNMADNIDICVADILEGKETIDSMGEKAYKFLQEVASGKLTKAEINGNREMAIYRIASTF